MHYELYQHLLALGFQKLNDDPELRKLLGQAIYLQMPGQADYAPLYLRLKPMGVRPKSTNSHEILHARFGIHVISREASSQPAFMVAHQAARVLCDAQKPQDWALSQGNLVNISCEKTQENWRDNGRIFHIHMVFKAVISLKKLTFATI